MGQSAARPVAGQRARQTLGDLSRECDPLVPEADVSVAGDDEMVEHSDVEEFSG